MYGGLMDAPQLDGIHHVKLPVRDLARSRARYESRLGYRAAIEFVEQGTLTGIAMSHPNGGPEFALRLDPARAQAAAGFDYFAIGVPSKEAIEDLGPAHLARRAARRGALRDDRLDPATAARPGRARGALLHHHPPQRATR